MPERTEVSTAPTLEVANLEVTYDGVPAVRGVNLTVGRGEVVGLIGPNGAGKSSTVSAIVGRVPARSGDVVFGGEQITNAAPELVARRGASLVPEGRQIYGGFTVDENLRLGLLARDAERGGRIDPEWVKDLFPIIREFRDRRAGELSGGQQQQLAIARALVANPSLLLLDEPSLGLAPTIVETVFAALGQVKERGVSILLVEQRAEMTIEFADRTHVMRDGRLVLEVERGRSPGVAALTSAYFGT